MDSSIGDILKLISVDLECLDGSLVPREIVINPSIYEKVKLKIPELRKRFSSSYMTSLHNNAESSQRWPLLNLLRQLLHTYHYDMKPIRKSDGYTKDGVKKYKRFFLICKSAQKASVDTEDSDIMEQNEQQIEDV